MKFGSGKDVGYESQSSSSSSSSSSNGPLTNLSLSVSINGDLAEQEKPEFAVED